MRSWRVSTVALLGRTQAPRRSRLTASRIDGQRSRRESASGVPVPADGAVVRPGASAPEPAGAADSGFAVGGSGGSAADDAAADGCWACGTGDAAGLRRGTAGPRPA